MSCCSPTKAVKVALSPSIRSQLPVAVLGAGPIGLAAAAHLLERGLTPIVFEASDSVGAGPLSWGHVPMFSPWRYDIDQACRTLLERHGWTAPNPEAFPTGQDLFQSYLLPLAATPEIAACLQLGSRITGVARIGVGKVRGAGRAAQPFEVRHLDAAGTARRVLVGAVIVATGTSGTPSPAGTSGLPAFGEEESSARIRYGMPDVLGSDRGRYAGRRVLVVGSGHSAIGTLLDLATLAPAGTQVHWAVRNANLTKLYGGGDADQLPERGTLGQRLMRLVESGVVNLLAPFAVDEFVSSAGHLDVRDASGQSVQVDEIVVATGGRPDLAILREVRLDLDPVLECPRALAPLIDPNVHSCGTVRPHGAEDLAQPDTGVFFAGMASYGRAPTFLLATGYEQVRSISAFLAGDIEAARRVELDLPQTGVCSGPAAAPTSCCAPSVKHPALVEPAE